MDLVKVSITVLAITEFLLVAFAFSAAKTVARALIRLRTTRLPDGPDKDRLVEELQGLLEELTAEERAQFATSLLVKHLAARETPGNPSSEVPDQSPSPNTARPKNRPLATVLNVAIFLGTIIAVAFPKREGAFFEGFAVSFLLLTGIIVISSWKPPAQGPQSRITPRADPWADPRRLDLKAITAAPMTTHGNR